MSTLCAIRFEIFQHFYHCHVWRHNYSLLMPNLVACCAVLTEIYKKNEFHFALEVSFSIYIYLT